MNTPQTHAHTRAHTCPHMSTHTHSHTHTHTHTHITTMPRTLHVIAHTLQRQGLRETHTHTHHDSQRGALGPKLRPPRLSAERSPIHFDLAPATEACARTHEKRSNTNHRPRLSAYLAQLAALNNFLLHFAGHLLRPALRPTASETSTGSNAGFDFKGLGHGTVTSPSLLVRPGLAWKVQRVSLVADHLHCRLYQTRAVHRAGSMTRSV